MFIWDFVAETVLGEILDWLYGQLVGFLGNFFAEMGGMGAELFEMEWVQAIVLFFSYLGWALYGVGLVVACFEAGVEYSGGRGNLRETALNVIRGFFAVSLFTQLPVRLYTLAVSLQGQLTTGITGYGSGSIGEAAQAALADFSAVDSISNVTSVLPPFSGLAAVPTSGIMLVFCLLLMAYAVIRVFFANLKRGGIPVIFEEQNINSIHPESEFLISLHAAFAQSESESASSRVKWGIRQSMRSGKVSIQYKTLLGYERGADGKPVIIPEQAETVRFIYERYLSGRPLRWICEELEVTGRQNANGTTSWTTSNLQTILTDEKYTGDVLRQKTFIQDCISKKPVQNTGQLPKYLIQNHHEAIISREVFDAVQLEMARRRAQNGSTRKSAPTGLGRYSGKYALSGLLFCGECGTAYRRVVWTQHGEKRPVWRCTSRLDYGRKYCKCSPTLDEVPLQQAVLAAINDAMSDRERLSAQLADDMAQELSPVQGESMSLGDIDRAMAELGRKFDDLLSEAANAASAEEYMRQFQALSAAMEDLKRRKSNILHIRQQQEQLTRRISAAEAAMSAASPELAEWDEGTVYQLLEKVTVLAGFKIKVTFRNGQESEQVIDQPKRRKCT